MKYQIKQIPANETNLLVIFIQSIREVRDRDNRFVCVRLCDRVYALFKMLKKQSLCADRFNAELGTAKKSIL